MGGDISCARFTRGAVPQVEILDGRDDDDVTMTGPDDNIIIAIITAP